VQRWYITFHGGENAEAWNNIHAFGLSGESLGKMLDTDSLPHGLHLRELRGFAFGPDGELYIANAYQDASQVLRFSGQLDARNRHSFRDIFIAQHHTNPGLDHPFAVTFGPDGHLFVPSQDTNVIGRYRGPAREDGTPGEPMPIPTSLAGSDEKKLLPGTFVASERHAPHGLRAVRGTMFGADGTLYAVDRDANSVKRYDGESGAFIREYTHSHLTSPIHLLPAGDGALLVGSRDANAIFRIDTASGDVQPLVKPGAGGLKGPAGMAIGPDGKLYVCSRESKQILRFDAATGDPEPAPFIDKLPDFPEFIALVDDRSS
jgi:DNA-binding beta-propeller fold protein YncE